MADTVQQIKDKLSIVEVVSGYVKLDRAGSTLRARCPFHGEKTPSFFVSPERGTYHCFGCGVGGDMFSFIEAIEGVDFKGALKLLADKAGVELVYERGSGQEKDQRERLSELMEAATIWFASKLDDKAKEYLTGRGVTEATMRSFRIGLVGNEWDALSTYLRSKKFTDAEIIETGMAKKNERGSLTDRFRNRVMFPIADTAGRIVAFSGRSFGEHASPEAPKYLNSPETSLFHKSRILYGFDKAKLAMRKADCAVLVEGQLDLVLSHQAGWSNTVAVSGTAFTGEHAKLIARHTQNLVIALDGDQAGVKAAARAAREALRGGLQVKVAALPQGKDPADLISQDGSDAWRSAIRNAKDIIIFLLDVMENQPFESAQNERVRAERFRKAVEVAVLPFLADIQSPIAREQYVREIARRLQVSQEAVLAALGAIPTFPVDPQQTTAAAPHKSSRADHALALLLWQERLPQPAFDIAEFETLLVRVIGADTIKAARDLPEERKEALRFTAERLFGASNNVEAAATELLHAIEEDSLRTQLSEVSRALGRAEREGDGKKMAQLEEKIGVLTTRIAEIHKKV